MRWLQGARRIAVGATKRHGLSPQEALAECGRPVSSGLEQSAAAEELMPRAEQAWPPISRCSIDPIPGFTEYTGMRLEQSMICLYSDFNARDWQKPSVY